MTIDTATLGLMATTLLGGGGLVKFFEWWSAKRSARVSADSVVMDNTKSLVEMLSKDVEQTRERNDKLSQDLNDLKRRTIRLESRQREVIDGCWKLIAQLREHDIEPAWEPPEDLA